MLSHEELIQKISLANRTNATGFPIMTDSEYDQLWAQLYAIDSYCPLLYHTTNDPTLDVNIEPHAAPVLGTQKAFSMQELLPFLTRFGHTELVLQPKYDGCAAVFYRQKDNKYKILLEGDGKSGRNITYHSDKLIFDPNYRVMESVEIVIPVKDWSPSYGANPRNVVSGWMNSSKTDFPSVTVVKHNNGPLEQEYKFNGDLDELHELLLTKYFEWSKLYPLDGIMIKVKDEALRIRSGHNNFVANWSIAWKPPIQTAKTRVINIEWNVSRLGRVIPTIIYSPIELCQTTNSRATGNNAQWISDMNIVIGAEIIVGKAGEIIPKIISVLPHSIYTPMITNCPVCAELLTWEGKHLVCHGQECFPQMVQKLTHFYGEAGMDLKSIGPANIEKILLNPLLYKIFCEHKYALLDPEVFHISAILETTLGSGTYQQYRRALTSLQGKRSIIQFMAGLGQEGLAHKTILTLYHYINGAKLNRKISPELVDSFITAYVTYERAKELMKNFLFSAPPVLPTKKYCITGTLSLSRDDMIQYLSQFDWEFSFTVTRDTDFLIVGDKPGQQKITRAEELKTKMIRENEIINYIKLKENQ